MQNLLRRVYEAMESENRDWRQNSSFFKNLPIVDLEALKSSVSYIALVDGLLAVSWLLQQDIEQQHVEYFSSLCNALMRCCIAQAREVIIPQYYRLIPASEQQRIKAAKRLSDRVNLLQRLGIWHEDSDASFFVQITELSDEELMKLWVIIPHMRRQLNDVSAYIQEQAHAGGSESPCVVYQSDYSNQPYVYFYIPKNPLFIGDLIESCLYTSYCTGYKNQFEILERRRQGLSQQYLDNFILLYSALSHPGNTDLCISIFLQSIKPHELIRASIIELEPAECRELRNKAREEIMANVDLKRFVQHTGIKCRKCKQETVVRLEKQTRSADEATTIEYTCSSCGHKWRVN